MDKNVLQCVVDAASTAQGQALRALRTPGARSPLGGLRQCPAGCTGGYDAAGRDVAIDSAWQGITAIVAQSLPGARLEAPSAKGDVETCATTSPAKLEPPASVDLPGAAPAPLARLVAGAFSRSGHRALVDWSDNSVHPVEVAAWPTACQLEGVVGALAVDPGEELTGGARTARATRPTSALGTLPRPWSPRVPAWSSSLRPRPTRCACARRRPASSWRLARTRRGARWARPRPGRGSTLVGRGAAARTAPARSSVRSGGPPARRRRAP